MFFDKATPQPEREDHRATGWTQIQYFARIAAEAWLAVATVVGSLVMFYWICRIVAGN